MTKHPYWTAYSADKNGSVYGQSGQRLKPIIHHTGYVVYTIRQHGLQQQVRGHRFIWECLVGPIPEGLVINHKDGNKMNNCLDNLECVTHQRNCVHAFETGLRKGAAGEDNSRSKLSAKDFFDLVDMLPTCTNREIGDKFGLHPNYVSLIRHKKRWRALWKLVEESSETIRKEYTSSDVEAGGTER